MIKQLYNKKDIEIFIYFFVIIVMLCCVIGKWKKLIFYFILYCYEYKINLYV